MRDLAKKHPQVQFLNASGGEKYFPECKLEELEMPDLDIVLKKGTLYEPICFDAWKESLLEDGEEIFEPLWKTWQPVFAREHRGNKKAMEIHKALFFQKVIKEHLDAIS